MKTITQTLMGETAEWERVNPILLKGMLGIEVRTDGSRRIKIGDGISTWKDPALKAVNPRDIEGLQNELDKLPQISTEINDISAALESDEEKLLSIGESLKDVIEMLSSERTEDIQALFRNITETIERTDESLTAAINDEANARRQADESLQAAIGEEAELRDETDQALRKDFNAWIGRGGYLVAFDFGTAEPAQNDLTDQALSQITSIDDPTQIWNGTKIVNQFDKHLWILTNTQDTDPPIFEWTDQGITELLPFDAGIGGYIIGANEADPPEYVRARPDGKGRIDIDAIMSAMLNRVYPVGSTYKQKLNDLTPEERDLPGQWENWSGRADGYRLTSSAIPAFTIYTPGANYSADAYVLWHLPGTGYELWKAKAAITSAAEQLDPVLWEKYVLGDIIERRYLQGWLDDDFEIGHVIEDGDYAGLFVSEVISLGGTFPSFEGGNRPPFVSGGVQQGRIMPITGDTGLARNIGNSYNVVNGKGAIRANVYPDNSSGVSNGSNSVGNVITLDVSLVHPVGPDVAGTNISLRYWRRVA